MPHLLTENLNERFVWAMIFIITTCEKTVRVHPKYIRQKHKTTKQACQRACLESMSALCHIGTCCSNMKSLHYPATSFIVGGSHYLTVGDERIGDLGIHLICDVVTLHPMHNMI